MPVLLFTVGEVAGGLILRQRQLSREILELADLKEKPLNPGESVGDRYHKIAKLGRQLAEAFEAFDQVANATSKDDDADAAPDDAKPTDAAPNSSQAN